MGKSSKNKITVKDSPLYALIRKLVESEIGAPAEKKRRTKQNRWYRIPYVPRKKDAIMIGFMPLEEKEIKLEGVDIPTRQKNNTKLQKREQEVQRGIYETLARFKQKKTQAPYFDLAVRLGLLFSRFHDLRDLHMSSEVTLHVPAGEEEKALEIGQRDFFIHGMSPNHDRRGISIEIESEFNRSSIRKLLYALYDTVHINIRRRLEPVSMLHHIILTKYISGYASKVLNLRHFENPEDLRGAFDLPTVYGKIISDPSPLSELISVLLEAHEVDPVGVNLHFENKLRDVVVGLEKIEKKLVEGKKLEKGDTKFLLDALEKLRQYNLWRHSISFDVTPELVTELKRDKKFLRNLVNYIKQRQFPTGLKARILQYWSMNETIPDVVLKDALDYLAKHARKTLQRTVIIHIPEVVSPGGDRKIDLDKIRIIRFKRLGKEYKLVPEIMTMKNYLDMLKREEWKTHAEAIEQYIRNEVLNPRKRGSLTDISLFKRGRTEPMSRPIKRKRTRTRTRKTK